MKEKCTMTPTAVNLRRRLGKGKPAAFQICNELEQYIQNSLLKFQQEVEHNTRELLMPMQSHIDMLDSRDTTQYEASRKLFETVNASLGKLSDQLSAHLASGATDYLSIESKLDGLLHMLNNITVNGGAYPLPEAMKQLYEKHNKTQASVEEMVTLTSGLRARKHWTTSTREVMQKSPVIHFLFTTKFGITLTAFTVVILLNSVLLDVFGVKLDIVSILKWVLKLVGGANG